jgi:hypothetical protein
MLLRKRREGLNSISKITILVFSLGLGLFPPKFIPCINLNPEITRWRLQHVDASICGNGDSSLVVSCTCIIVAYYYFARNFVGDIFLLPTYKLQSPMMTNRLQIDRSHESTLNTWRNVWPFRALDL